MDDSTSSYTSQSIFGLLSAHNLGWSIYGYDSEPLTRLNFPDTTNAPETHFGQFTDFQAAAAAGSLGVYTFLEPSWGSSGNSQHPELRRRPGRAAGSRRLLRARERSELEPDTSHRDLRRARRVLRPCGSPVRGRASDTCAGEFGFDFTRFGVRVPAVLVSPLIPAGTVFRPTGTVPLDHTSILKTVETRWGLPSLTARDAAAPDVGDVLSLSTPRTDDPLEGVSVPTSTGTNPAVGTASHIQQIHAQLVSRLPVDDAAGTSHLPMPTLSSESDYKNYIDQRTARWKESTEHQQTTQPPAGN